MCYIICIFNLIFVVFNLPAQLNCSGELELISKDLSTPGTHKTSKVELRTVNPCESTSGCIELHGVQLLLQKPYTHKQLTCCNIGSNTHDVHQKGQR